MFTTRTLACTALALTVLCCVLASVVSAQEAPAPTDADVPAPTNKHKKHQAVKAPARRSLFQACRAEIASVGCLNPSAKGGAGTDPTALGRKRALRGTIACLEENSDKLKDATCKSWLAARRRCKDDVRDNDVCPKLAESKQGARTSSTDDVSRCLLTGDATKLSKLCTESEFYRALTFQRRWRERRDQARKIQGNDKPADRKANQ